MVIEKEIIIEKGIDKAWKILGPEFAQAYKWASAVNHSEGRGNSFEGATCSERGCETSMGKLKEKLLAYSAEKHSLSYQITEGMPSMVRYATNTWTLTPVNADRTQLHILVDMRVGGFLGMLMKPMMKLQMSKMGGELVEDFKYYVENGKPHPRKIKAAAKFKAR